MDEQPQVGPVHEPPGRAYTRVPLSELLSDGVCGPAAAPYDPATEGLSTTHLTTADRWGNVVPYKLTIEFTGGSGNAVPGWGFLLNNESPTSTSVDLGRSLPQAVAAPCASQRN